MFIINLFVCSYLINDTMISLAFNQISKIVKLSNQLNFKSPPFLRMWFVVCGTFCGMPCGISQGILQLCVELHGFRQFSHLKFTWTLNNSIIETGTRPFSCTSLHSVETSVSKVTYVMCLFVKWCAVEQARPYKYLNIFIKWLWYVTVITKNNGGREVISCHEHQTSCHQR